MSTTSKSRSRKQCFSDILCESKHVHFMMRPHLLKHANKSNEAEREVLLRGAFGRWIADLGPTFLVLDTDEDNETKHARFSEALSYTIIRYLHSQGKIARKLENRSTAIIYAMPHMGLPCQDQTKPNFLLTTLQNQLWQLKDQQEGLGNAYRKFVYEIYCANEYAVESPPTINLHNSIRILMSVLSRQNALKSLCLFLDGASLPSEDAEAAKVLRFLRTLADNCILVSFKIFFVGKHRSSFVAQELGCTVTVDLSLLNMFQDSRLQGPKLLPKGWSPEQKSSKL